MERDFAATVFVCDHGPRSLTALSLSLSFPFDVTVLVLGASNIRLIIENWMKYGLLIRLPHSYIPYQDYPLSVLAWLSVPICLAITFLIEVGMSHLAKIARNAKPDFRNKVTILNNLAAAAHFMHLSFLLTYPSYIVYTKIYHPLSKSGLY